MVVPDERKIEIATEYFRRVDAGDPTLIDLFHEDASFYFPKFGLGQGRASILEMINGFTGVLEWIRHDYASFVFTLSGDRVAVEGLSKGKMVGGNWEGSQTPGGRFCNVFEFRGARFARLYVYLDPDYLGEDKPRFRWGKNSQRW